MEYIYSAEYGAIMGISMFLTLVVLLGIGLSYLSNRNRGYPYRRFLTNLFVAGKVRQLAEAEKVDLEKEYLKFLEFDKLHNEKYRRDIDAEIEDKVASKIEEEK